VIEFVELNWIWVIFTVELNTIRSRNIKRWYLLAGASVFASAIAYYAIFRSQLPWPGQFLNLDWARLSHLKDYSGGSYPSFAFTLSMGLIAVGLFVTQRSSLITAIVGIWFIGLLHEISLSTFTVTDVIAGTLGALVALRAGLLASRLVSSSTSSEYIAPKTAKTGSKFSALASINDRTRLVILMFSSIVFATATTPYEERTSRNCLETDVNGICINESIARTPVYLGYDKLRSAVKVSESRTLTSVSRIYLYDSYIFANELNEGIHIIDNSFPASPKRLGFIEIPGNQDIAIRDNSLYADSYIDLVTIDLSDIDNIREIARVEDVFPYNARQNIPAEVRLSGSIDRSRGVVIGYE